MRFNPPQWKPLYDEFEERTDNGANCPKCGKRAIEHRTKHHHEYGGTKSEHGLRCECGQYFVVYSYMHSD